MSAIFKPSYRSPSRSADAEVSLSEFGTDELRNEIAHREGGAAGTGESHEISGDMMNRLRTLVLCGQRESALRELCLELEPYVGRLQD